MGLRTEWRVDRRFYPIRRSFPALTRPANPLRRACWSVRKTVPEKCHGLPRRIGREQQAAVAGGDHSGRPAPGCGFRSTDTVPSCRRRTPRTVALAVRQACPRPCRPDPARPRPRSRCCSKPHCGPASARGPARAISRRGTRCRTAAHRGTPRARPAGPRARRSASTRSIRPGCARRIVPHRPCEISTGQSSHGGSGRRRRCGNRTFRNISFRLDRAANHCMVAPPSTCRAAKRRGVSWLHGRLVNELGRHRTKSSWEAE